MLKTPETARKRTALGQGLDALIPLDEPIGRDSSSQSVNHVSIAALIPNPHQPRRLFSEESLADLSASIQEMGVIQPLIVRNVPGGRYEIVAGERRWRAAKNAGFATIPVIVKDVSDSESLEIALIENLQREDLNPIDTAEAYDVLVKKFSYTHEVLAKRIGKDRTSVTNYLRLLKLPDQIKEDLREDRITMGHARTLLAIDHAPTQLNISSRIVKRKLSVRELEKIVQNYKKKTEEPAEEPQVKDIHVNNLEKGLSRLFSTKVSMTQRADQSGKVVIHFHSKEELDRLLEAFGYTEDFS
jgi:ParB family chromosome partitioning protein